jgi:apolipoprotein N-acyltransferase
MNYITERDESRRSLPHALALAVLSAILMTLAVPNELFKQGLAALGFVALVPLYLAVMGTAGPKAAALVVGLFGSLQHGLSSFWLWFFKDFRFWTLGSTTAAYFVVYMVLGFYLWLFLRRSGRARPIAFAVLWASFEYLKSTGFLGYPWALLPYSLTDALPLLQIADLAGVYGISALLATCNAALAELLVGAGSPPGAAVPLRFGASRPAALALRSRLAYVALALALTAGALGYGFARMARPIPLAGSIDAVLVQQNTDPWVSTEDEALSINIRLAKQAIAEARAKGRAPDIVLFSETTLRRPYAEFHTYYSKHPALDPLVPFIRESGTWLFAGAPVVVDWKTGDATNSAILIDPSGRLVRSYAKIHLVPFAESIPFWEFAPFRKFIRDEVGLDAGWAAGTDYTIFDLPTKEGSFRFGAPICFEDAFADVCRNFYLRDADLLVNLTDVSWSKTESAEIQHWAAARFRAIEARRTLVRSTNGGLTCVVGPYGELLDSLPLFTAGALTCRVPIYRGASPTLYINFGDWFARAALLLSAALFIILSIGEWRERTA